MSGPAELLVGLDVGTTNVKAAAYGGTGERVAAVSVPLPSRRPRPGWEEYDAAELATATFGALRRLTEQVPAGNIKGLAVASMGETAVPLDARDVPLHPALAWHDQRGIAEARALVAAAGPDRFAAITGIAPRHIFGVFKLLWFRHHVDRAGRLACWLNVSDYVTYLLCGQRATSPSLATRMALLDLDGGDWSAELLAAAGIDATVFAPVVDSGTPLGTVTTRASAATGLPMDVVVSVGGHDHPCGALGAGLLRDDTVLDSLGTAESVFAAVGRPVLTPAVMASGYEQGRYVTPGGTYAMGGVYTSGAAVDWAANLLGLSGADRHARLLALAEQAPAGADGVLFLPHLRLANPPYNDSRSRGAFVGLSDRAGRESIARAVVEGLAYEFFLSYSGLADTFALPVEQVVAIGGGSGNRLGLAIKQRLLDVPLEVATEPEAASLGAAMLGGIGAGLFPDAAAASAAMRCARTPLPAAELGVDAAFYRRVYAERYEPLYRRLAPIHHEIADDQCDPDDALADPVVE